MQVVQEYERAVIFRLGRLRKGGAKVSQLICRLRKGGAKVSQLAGSGKGALR